MKLQHTKLLQNLSIAIVFYHKYWHFNEQVKLLGYLTIGKNGEPSKVQDMVLVNLIHLTDPECPAITEPH